MHTRLFRLFAPPVMMTALTSPFVGPQVCVDQSCTESVVVYRMC